MKRTSPPYRADHVGSLLRPPELLQARDEHANGRIDDETLGGIEDEAIRDVGKMQQDVLRARRAHATGGMHGETLRGIEDEAIRDVVKMQQDVGLQTATDGEFRRASWHMDFIYSIEGVSKAPGKLP